MTFTFVVATSKQKGTRLPIHEFLDKVKFPDWTWVDTEIIYENKRGLSECYNEAINKHLDSDYCCFVHDDWTCNDFEFFKKVQESKFDLIGTVGGLQYCVPSDWQTRPFLWTEACQGKASGFVLHKHPIQEGLFLPSSFGIAPLPCVWLDGQMLILSKKAVNSGLRYDEDFQFDFYDGSLCFRALDLGLSVGTAPILATHESCGQGMMAHKGQYLQAQKHFIQKYLQKK